MRAFLQHRYDRHVKFPRHPIVGGAIASLTIATDVHVAMEMLDLGLALEAMW